MEEALVTSTLGEIYLRQGLFDRAEAVFEQLLEEDPGNEHLRHRLDETRDLMGSQEGTASDRESEARGSTPVDADEASAISVELLAPDESGEPDVLPPVGVGIPRDWMWGGHQGRRRFPDPGGAHRIPCA